MYSLWTNRFISRSLISNWLLIGNWFLVKMQCLNVVDDVFQFHGDPLVKFCVDSVSLFRDPICAENDSFQVFEEWQLLQFEIVWISNPLSLLPSNSFFVWDPLLLDTADQTAHFLFWFPCRCVFLSRLSLVNPYCLIIDPLSLHFNSFTSHGWLLFFAVFSCDWVCNGWMLLPMPSWCCPYFLCAGERWSYETTKWLQWLWPCSSV